MRHKYGAATGRFRLSDALGTSSTLRQQRDQFTIDIIDARTLHVEVISRQVHHRLQAAVCEDMYARIMDGSVHGMSQNAMGEGTCPPGFTTGRLPVV